VQQRLQLYREQARPEDWALLVLLSIPLMLCFWWQFQGTLPFWLMGFLAGLAAYRRYTRPVGGLLLLLGIVAVLGTTLVEHDWLSGAWVMPLTHLLWFVLAAPAGLHVGWVSHPREEPPPRG